MTSTPEHPTLLSAEAARHLQQLQEHHADVWQQWRAIPAIASSLTTVWSASDFVARSCARDPALLQALVSKHQLEAPLSIAALLEDLASSVHGNTEPELMEALRRFRRRHMVRIAWRDIARWADLDETLR